MASGVVDVSSSTGSFQTAPTSLAGPSPGSGSGPGSGPGPGPGPGASTSSLPSIYQYYHTYHTRSFIDSISSPESVTGLDELHNHLRTVSNPFDVLYTPGRRPVSAYVDPYAHYAHNPAQLHQMAHNPAQLHHPHNPAQLHHIASPPPVITVIDQPVRRSGSVISNSATLRNRNRIKKRNQAFLRSPTSDIDTITTASTGPKESSLRDKIRFMFPVHRKKSLRYSSVRKQHANFHTKDQLQAFLTSSNAESLIKDLLPRQTSFFHYDSILPPSPTIKSVRKNIHIVNQGRSFSIHPALASQAPLTAKNSQKAPPRAKHARAYSSIPLPDIIYQKYKTAVFANKHTVPPKFELLFPNDLHLLSTNDIKNINRKLLLEVLLRRTLAAKIEYRLKQHNYTIPRLGSTKTTGTGSTFSSSSPSYPHKLQEKAPSTSFHSHKPRTETTATSKTSSMESINTEKLMQQNASLFSELLPSPQISYTSDIFGSIYLKDEISLSYDSIEAPAKREVPSRSILRKEPPAAQPRKAPSTNRIIRLPSNELLYINDFNKAYYNRYKAKDDSGFEQSLFSSNVYQLRPMQRSVATISSSEKSVDARQNSSLISPLNISSTEDLASTSHRKKPSLSSSAKSKRHSLPSEGSKRKSQSTTNTSIFQNLDDLSSDLSSFIDDIPRNKAGNAPKGPPPLSPFEDTLFDSQLKRHSLSSLDKLTYPKSSLRLVHKDHSSSQTILESINRSAQYSPIKLVPQPVTHESIEKQNPAIDILSLKGSISMVGSNCPTESASVSTSPEIRRKSRSISRDRTHGQIIHE
ncbi:uncharacterized protein CANTADRAFT_21536 [Suhomyces tanzawaensis NRRL Y-17324]|uniref:Uncharacterized protein n=1 Tax=Suhomyces tanzawaensis NRRL Y-17324 TaxID=984487 RepID=A0A1E4SLB9_9ASCO|nr:uncharacterized protein CANTADRAFT_21536 [Suhomyces tanzawaensis NRRL Y-17324]ODV80299.1 hypothetical protein CANTADRAFT_21536 [Suhomyces tanzawaensis NRRL Y-17324]